MQCIVERDLDRHLAQLDAAESFATAREAALEGLFEEFLDRAQVTPNLVYDELALSDEGTALLALGNMFTRTDHWWSDCCHFAAQQWAERKINESQEDDRGRDAFGYSNY